MAATIGVTMPTRDIMCRVPATVVEALDEEARLIFGSRSAVIRQVFADWLDRRNAERAETGSA